jgi:hypothetical protein
MIEIIEIIVKNEFISIFDRINVKDYSFLSLYLSIEDFDNTIESL